MSHKLTQEKGGLGLFSLDRHVENCERDKGSLWMFPASPRYAYLALHQQASWRWKWTLHWRLYYSCYWKSTTINYTPRCVAPRNALHVHAFTSPDDSRLQVSDQFAQEPSGLFVYCMVCSLSFMLLVYVVADFLQYINDWECTAQSNDQCTPAQKMCLSEETIEGLRITGIFIAAIHPCQLRGQV